MNRCLFWESVCHKNAAESERLGVRRNQGVKLTYKTLRLFEGQKLQRAAWAVAVEFLDWINCHMTIFLTFVALLPAPPGRLTAPWVCSGPARCAPT